MKKAAIIFLASLLLYGLSKSFFITTSTQFPPANIVPEAIFVEIVRDLTLLGSWLLYKRDPEKTTDGMRQQSHQKILALYAVDPQAFEESVKYYLEDAPERALKVYEQVCMALDAL